MGDWVDSLNSITSDVNSGLNSVDRATRAGGKVVGAAGDVLGAGASMVGGSGSNASPKGGATSAKANTPVTPLASSSTVLGSPIQVIDGKTYFSAVAPEDTRIIIPQEISSTGQERYLGVNAATSLVNLIEKKDGAGNVVVLDETGKPSMKVYDVGPNGEVFIKGTNIKVNMDAQKSVRLSEKEFDAVVNMYNSKTQNPTYFKTSKESGAAEDTDTDSSSWFGRNWWKVLLGAVAIAGITWGGIAWYNHNTRSKSQTVSNTSSNGSSGGNNGTLANAGTAFAGSTITDFITPLWQTNQK